MRAAIYARFSTELQSERSVEDQVALCRGHAAKNGLDVVAVYEDRARSGASIIGRDGLMQLLDAARDRTIDVILVESLDRLSRDMEDLAGIYKRLSFLGVELTAVHEGRADTVTVGLRGLVGQLFREDNAKKVRRGMAGVIRDGRHAGDRAYGYRTIPGKPGHLQIDEQEAEVVREIFVSYAAGDRPREIAARLNARKVSPPRGRFWTASAINGSMTRGNGIILNRIYAGRIVWNKVQMVKHPDTGRRLSRPNPKSEWQPVDAPHLRIIDQDLYEKAVALKLERSGPKPVLQRKPKRVPSGLLKCGRCGAGMSQKDQRKGRIRIQCTQMKEAGTCENRHAYDLQTIERTVFDGLRANLTDPTVIAEYVATYNAERKRLAAAVVSGRAKLEKRLAQAARELDRAIDSIIKGIVDPESLRDRIKTLESEKRQLEAELQAAEKPPQFVSLHPTAIASYREQIEDLHRALSADALAGDQAPVRALRELVACIIVMPTRPGEPVKVEVRGRLAALMDRDVFPQARMWGGKVVAEEGLEPPTRGL